jgi:hypothetical protein
LEGQIEEDEEDARCIAALVACAGEACDHCCQARCRYEAPAETGDEHPASGVDFVV